MNKVSVGLATVVGYALTGIGAAATAWAAAEGASSSISPGLLAVITTVAGTFTTLGRMYQAGQSAPVEVLTERPEAGVRPDVPPPASS